MNWNIFRKRAKQTNDGELELTEAAGLSTADTEPDPETGGWFDILPKLTPWGSGNG